MLPFEFDDAELGDKRKQSLYFPLNMLREIKLESDRHDRSMSWVVQQAWRIARTKMLHLPSTHSEINKAVQQSRASAHGGALEQ